MGMIRLAVDALGGDFAPREIVAGAVHGARHLGIELLLVCEPALVEACLGEAAAHGVALEVVPARGAIHMEADPARAVRAQPEASINVACRLVLEGRADGVLTMGHTGAGMIAALFNFGRIPGVERPAAIVPLLGLRPDLFLIDAGANTEVRPKNLFQFARMGAAYIEHAIGLPRPKVGLLSNGAEANKGNTTGREAYPLLAAADDLNFVGNVEGNRLLAGEVNLIVADGFAGNILLKSAEGIVAGVLEQVAEVLPQLEAESAQVVQAHLDLLNARNHYSRHGAAALLGVQHPMFIGHGRSRAAAVVNGMATAQRAIAGGVVDVIRQAFAGSSG